MTKINNHVKKLQVHFIKMTINRNALIQSSYVIDLIQCHYYKHLNYNLDISHVY